MITVMFRPVNRHKILTHHTRQHTLPLCNGLRLARDSRSKRRNSVLDPPIHPSIHLFYSILFILNWIFRPH